MRAFHRTFFLTLTILLLATAAFSFVIDPGDLYLNRIENRRHLSETIDLLVIRDTAVAVPHDEREFKMALAEGALEGDCFIVGSSRVLQLSSVRTGPIQGCGRVVNLGVSGGTLEDLILMADVALTREPEQVFLGIDPWMGKWDQDARWRAFTDEAAMACQNFDLDCPIPAGAARVRDLAVNLINLEYVTAGIEDFRTDETVGPENPTPEETVLDTQPSDEERLPFTVMLSDGSAVYGDGAFTPVAEPVRLTYKMDEPSFNRSAMDALAGLLEALSESVDDLIIVLPPFHPGAADNPTNQAALDRVAEFEAELRAISTRLGITVLGTYDGNRTDCSADQFYDEIHASSACLFQIISDF